MQAADAPARPADHAPDRSSRSPVSVAILAAVACVPIVIAAGFLADRGDGSGGVAAVPGDISALALRGALDGGADRPPPIPARAGY